MHAHERAFQIWPILVLAARNRQTLTYDLLSRLIGVPRIGLGQLLEPIQSYCLINGLPALTSTVVGDDGLPGPGFIAVAPDEVPAEQQRVYAHDWLDAHAPNEQVLRQAAIDRPSNGIPQAAAIPALV